MCFNIRRITVMFLFFFYSIRGAHVSKAESDKIIKIVNSMPKNSWKAEFNFDSKFLKNASRLVGVLPWNTLDSVDVLHTYEVPTISVEFLPENYDVTQKWSDCKSVVTIRDQSNCGSCWAISSASAFSDRLCIASNTKINEVLSGEYINSCCNGNCGNGCNGGHPEKAWKFIKRNGICTGGEYNSDEGCQPYSIAPCPRNENKCKETNAATPRCYKTQCTNPYYETSMSTDLYYASKIYSVKPKMEEIMNEIYKKGPVVAAMKVYEDFLYYKSGIYQYVTGALNGDHAVKLMGWGQDDGIDYWICANTWGTSWGMKGNFKIRRGRNECGIESRITCGIPKV